MTEDDDLLGDGSPRGPGDPGKPNARETMDDDDHEFDASPDVLTAAAQGRLRTIVERIERLEEDKAAVMADIKEVYAEAKGEGYSVPILRAAVRRRKKDKAKLQEEDAILDLYLSALGDI